MYYTFKRPNDIADYGTDRKMRIDAVLKIFQEAAVLHSASVGYSADSYMGHGNIWILTRIMLNAEFLPDLAQEIEVTTWSRGLDRFKGLRNYEIKADGKTCVRGSSVWLYIDIAKKRPVRITQEMLEKYDSESVCNMDHLIDKWETKGADNYDADTQAFLRPADFDVNGHMNNIRYVELFGLVTQHMELTGKNIGLYYAHEIPYGVKTVSIKHSEQADSDIFSIFNGEELACLCEIFK